MQHGHRAEDRPSGQDLPRLPAKYRPTTPDFKSRWAQPRGRMRKAARSMLVAAYWHRACTVLTCCALVPNHD